MGLNTYFISDLHLGANYLKQPHCNERRVVHFLDSIRHDVAELYLLGDILDYWYEYKYVVPRGYVRFFGKLAELADAGVKIYWFTGNHDVWLFDYLRDEIGMTVLKTCQQVTIGGKQFFISHGDDIGHQPRSYRFMRWCFYNRVCQMLYAAVHPRWTYAIATGWSADNRTHRNAQQQAACVERSADDLIQFSQHYATQHPASDSLCLWAFAFSSHGDPWRAANK